MTTHNTSILTNDLLRPDCYFLMKKDIIRSLSKRTSKELREAHNIEKCIKQVHSMSNNILFVFEGEKLKTKLLTV